MIPRSKPPVVVLSGVRWDFLWQRHQTLATLFARAGYPTVFVETTGIANPAVTGSTLRKVASRIRHSGGERTFGQKNLAVYAPLALPPTFELFRGVNRRFFVPRTVRDLLGMTGPDPVVVAYAPTRTTLDLILGLRPRAVLYDRADDYAYFPGAPRDVANTERELLGLADLVSCTSEYLLRQVRPSRPDAFLSGPAVDYGRFALLQEENPGGEIGTVCFFGRVGQERTDLRALRAIAGAGFEVRLLGEVDRSARAILNVPGVQYGGAVPHEGLPASLAGVDAYLLPYEINNLTKGISPAKTYEYLATGKPVVASPLPALRDLAEHVYVANEPPEFVDVLRRLGELESEEKAQARVRLARENSWETRFGEIEEALWHAI